MTREEAIEIVKYMADEKKESVSTDSSNLEALEMAIKALSAEPCEDAVSRQAVIDSLHNKFADGFDSDRWWNSMTVLHVINKVPPVTPKPKTGHWIDIANKNGTVIAIRCSCCDNSPKHAIRSDFCPNCGSDMRGEEEC